jgi:hypothetical protein
MNGDIAANQKKGQVYLADRTLWEQVPEFEYTAPGTAWVLGHYTTSLGVLLLWTAAAIAFMVRSATVARAD